MAKPLLAGNWKMHGTATSAAKLASEIAEISGENPEIIVFPSFVSIPGVVSALSGRKNVAVGAQNRSRYSDGAYTGEISGQMLAELGCTYVLVGHSERRTYNAESNELVAEKFSAAQKSGLTPLEADSFINYCTDDLKLPINGLMCIPPQDEEPSMHFAFLKKIAKRKVANIEKSF